MLKPPMILIADDDQDDLLFFREAIEKLRGGSYSVSCVENGAELLRRVHDPVLGPPDIIVLDLNMPIKDGITVLRELKAEEPYSHIPVFILSTSSRPDDISACVQLGCSQYYTKPFHLSEYRSIVSDILQRSMTAAQ